MHTPHPTRLRAKWLLLPTALLLLATSRPLAEKDLTGTAEVPDGLAVPVAPQARFGENTNNQGCFADQRLDLRVVTQVQNDGEGPVTLREADATIRIDGEVQDLSPHTYSVGGERTVVPFAEYTIEPGETEEVVVYSYGFMPFEAFETTDHIEVTLPVGEAHLRVVFEDVQAVQATRR